MKIVVGLGNPGEEYENTRHNAGRMVVENISKKIEKNLPAGRQVKFITPDTFMNHSGKAVAPFVKAKKDLKELIVIYDDIDLPLGKMKISFNRSSGGHNGLESIIAQFGTEEIPRLRVGIGAAPSHGSVDHVLGRFFEEEKPVVRSTVERSADAVKWAIDNGLVSAMNSFNKSEL